MVFRWLWQGLLAHYSPPHGGLMVRSALLWGLGDVGAQAVTHYSTQDKDGKSISFVEKDKEFKINWYRVFNTSFFGHIACIGPAAYYRSTKGLPRSSTSAAEFAFLTYFDALFFGTLHLATYFPLMGHLHGKTKSLEKAKEDVNRGFKPALMLGGAVLPVALFTNWRFVPAPYQLHCASLFAVVGSCYLSWNELELYKDGVGTKLIRKTEGVRFDRTSVRSG